MLRHYHCLTRAEIVAKRARFGDWEASLIFASKGKAALLSCNKSKSRFHLLSKVEDKTAAAAMSTLIGRLLNIPFALRQTLTLDNGNGSETARFKKLEAATGKSVYFFVHLQFEFTASSL